MGKRPIKTNNIPTPKWRQKCEQKKRNNRKKKLNNYKGKGGD